MKVRLFLVKSPIQAISWMKFLTFHHLTFSTSSSDVGPSTRVDESSATQPKTQSALETFFVDAQNSMPSQEPTAKELSDKLDKVLNILSTSASTLEEKGSSKNEVSTEGIPDNSASNITEFLAMNKDIELIGDSEEKTLRCKICFIYLNSKSALQRSSSLPSSVCLFTGLLLRYDAYQNFILGHNNVRYHIKKRLGNATQNWLGNEKSEW